MTPSDDVLKISTAFSLQPGASNEVKAAFASITQAPLRSLIAEFLRATPAVRMRECLQEIADLNQGSLADLDSPEFQSYLIRKLQCDQEALRTCTSALVTYSRVTAAAEFPEQRTLLAARSEDGSARISTSAADVLRELRRRL